MGRIQANSDIHNRKKYRGQYFAPINRLKYNPHKTHAT